MRAHKILATLTATLLLGACANPLTPAAFTPLVEPPPADAAAFEGDFAACAAKVAADDAIWEGQRAFDAGSVGLEMLSIDPTLGILTVIILGMEGQQAERLGKTTGEAVQASMTSCLHEKGYTVLAWTPVSGRSASSVRLRTPTAPKLKWHAFVFPLEGDRSVELEARFDTLDQCKTGGLAALRDMGVASGGYGCQLGCYWSEPNRSYLCEQTWASDRRTEHLMTATGYEAAAARDEKSRDRYLSWAARARQDARKTPPANLSALRK